MAYCLKEEYLIECFSRWIFMWIKKDILRQPNDCVIFLKQYWNPRGSMPWVAAHNSTQLTPASLCNQLCSKTVEWEWQGGVVWYSTERFRSGTGIVLLLPHSIVWDVSEGHLEYSVGLSKAWLLGGAFHWEPFLETSCHTNQLKKNMDNDFSKFFIKNAKCGQYA